VSACCGTRAKVDFASVPPAWGLVVVVVGGDELDVPPAKATMSPTAATAATTTPTRT